MDSRKLEDQIGTTEHMALAVERGEGGSRYLSLVKTHLELARFYANQRIKERLNEGS